MGFFCKHNWITDRYTRFYVYSDNTGKYLGADTYQIKECVKCSKMHKEKLYSKHFYTYDDLNKFIVEEAQR